MSIRVLFVEDEIGIAKIVEDSLSLNGFEVQHCTESIKALQYFIKNKADIILLDVMIPELDGFNFAAKIREIDLQVPIIFITARTQTADVLKGFENGANDYIKKPFSIEELMIRMNFHLDQIPKSYNQKYQIGTYEFDARARQLHKNGKETNLSYRESELLKKLCERKNGLLKRAELLEQLWETDNFYTGRSLDVFISRLRGYLNSDPNISIVNVRRIGYKLVVKNEN